MNQTGSSATCQRTVEEMASVLDGSAPPEVLEHVADCDTCRDARYDAERAELLMGEAGGDFQLPEDFAARLQTAPAPVANTLSMPAATTIPAAATPTVPEPAAAPSPPPAPRAGAAPSPRENLRIFAKRWTVPVIAAAAAAAILVGRAQQSTSADDPDLSGPPWRGKVGKIVSQNGKLEVCAPSGSTCRDAREGDEVPAGSQLRTDRRTLAELSFSDGSALSLDRETTLRLSTRGRGGELTQGGVVADVAHVPNSGVRFEFRGGHLDVLGTKFSLRTDDESAAVHVARGEVRLSDGRGHDAMVRAGEEGRVYPGSPPTTSAGTSLGEALGWSEAVQAVVDDEPEARPRALGELKAQKPGEKAERSGAVRLDSHAVRVKIAGSVARTEVEEVFTNQTDEVLEGIFRFPLPPDAKIERLALEVDGKLEEGAFVDRERAAAIWRGAIVNAAPQMRQQIKDEIVWVPGPWRDPALLEWQRGGRFELRIFPIPRRGSRRVVLAYSQVVKQAASVRHYSYPLGFDPSGNSTPLDFSIDVQVRGNDPAFRVRTPGWSVRQDKTDGAEHLRFDAKSFVPNGDFGVDYALPDRASEVSAWAYRDASGSGDAARPFVALALRPKLPRQLDRGPGRAVALVVDASRSVFGENYRRATALAARLARELEPSDRLTVLACDNTCREMPGDLHVPGAQTAREVRRFLEHETPEGASDITFAVARGFAALSESGRAPHVIYIGDGTATAGPTRPSTIERAVRAALPTDGRVISLGIGPESDAESLFALARGGGGSALPYVPGQPLSDAAMSAISALYGATLSDVRLELPQGFAQVAPARLDPVVAGSELLVTGRLDASELKGDAVLRGTLNGRPFEQRYPLDVTVSDSSGNAFVPRLFAAARISDLERDGSDSAKRESIALSTQHSVASRYTSLLVLESEAMYKAFGLDNARKTPEYTADLEAEGSTANGELALLDDANKAKSKDEAPLGSRMAKGDSARSATSINGAERRSDGGGLAGIGAPNPFDSTPAAGPKSAAGRAAPAQKPAFAPPPAPTAAAPEPERAAEKKQIVIQEDSMVLQPVRPSRPRPRDMIPMRRVWERKGEVFTDRFVPKAASGSALTDATRELQRDDSRRQSLKKAFALSSAAGDLGEAARLAERWLDKEPLDPEAITALADVEARRGHREAAIRMLGSVLDVRPGDTASHKRLARLERWAGHVELACRHSIAIAEGKSQDVALVADAVRCARAIGLGAVAEALLDASSATNRSGIEQRLSQAAGDDALLNGDLRLEASWNGGPDLDLSLLDTEGHRVSWLGADTRAVISARDATSTSREGLALRGAAPGEYVIELTRGAGPGSTNGELVVTVAGTVRRIPFSFDGDRKAVALLRVSMQSRLVGI
ncbi:MAG TPA: VIT domain-containing protein [Polyangiaceae bacterium]|nr:VIT domain-containing protein [Polyangiaceae bacterium]